MVALCEYKFCGIYMYHWKSDVAPSATVYCCCSCAATRHYSCTHETPGAAAAAAGSNVGSASKPPVRFYAWTGLQQQQQQQQVADTATQPSSSSRSGVPVLLPLPYLLPPKQYQQGEVPWCVDPPRPFPGADAFGYTCGNTPLRYYGNTEPPWDA